MTNPPDRNAVRQPAIMTTALEKSYGAVNVLQGIDLRVEAGTVFSLLGPNGAGKTTMVRILSTLTQPDAGSAQVAGFDVVRQRHQVRRAVSVTGQFAAIDALQTGRENLAMMGRLGGLSRGDAGRRATKLLARFDLTDASDRRVITYSGGMRRRLDLAASLTGSPRVIFLDEPTTGLDPRSRQAMWDVVRELVEDGVTVFLTTQYLDEADRLAGRIAVLDKGRIIAEGTPLELKQRVAQQRLELTCTSPRAFEQLTSVLGNRALRREVGQLAIGVATDGTASNVRGLLDELDPHCQLVERFDVHVASLDDVFLAITGQSAKPSTSEVKFTHV